MSESERSIDLASARKAGTLCDLTIKCGSKRIKAHKLPLQLASSYFMSAFSSGLLEASNGEVDLSNTNISAETMERILAYVYSGEVSLTKENVLELHTAADYLGMPKLASLCLEGIKKHVDGRNVLAVLKYADGKFESASELYEMCLELFDRSFCDAVNSPAFEKLTFSDLAMLLARKSLKIESENQVLECLMAWMSVHWKSRAARKDEVLGLIRFQEIDADRFLTSSTFLDLMESDADPIMKESIVKAILFPKARGTLVANPARTTWEKTPTQLIAVVPVKDGYRFFSLQEDEDSGNLNWIIGAAWKNRGEFLATCSSGGYIYALQDVDYQFYILKFRYGVEISKFRVPDAVFLTYRHASKKHITMDFDNGKFMLCFALEYQGKFQLFSCHISKMQPNEEPVCKILPTYELPPGQHSFPTIFKGHVCLTGGSSSPHAVGVYHGEPSVPVPLMQFPHSKPHRAVVYEDRIYVAGGGTRNAEYFEQGWKSWRPLPPMPTQKDEGFTIAACKDRLFVISATQQKQVEWLDLKHQDQGWRQGPSIAYDDEVPDPYRWVYLLSV